MMKRQQVLALPIGMICLAIAILMEKFLPANNFLDFIEGLLTGLSIVLNIYYIFAVSHKNKK
ncbi:MAG: hypothetical protein NTY07_00660 [Bacteroidia bacterium]|nr:hypothetical protein [Bacteroidia bacterium]